KGGHLVKGDITHTVSPNLMKLNSVIFPLKPKTHFFGDILPEHEARSSGRNAHIRNSTTDL
uniref:Uncharacterized protein n=1 Tax=Sinocyclocheilus anshuiensis TaxID=1608454 RepID=A0A671K8P0_9TELE